MNSLYCKMFGRNTNANWFGHILHRNCLLKHIIEGKLEKKMMIIRGKSSKQLLYDLKETTGYWKMKQDVLEGTMWRTRFVRLTLSTSRTRIRNESLTSLKSPFIIIYHFHSVSKRAQAAWKFLLMPILNLYDIHAKTN
jgi:hypothetical protein